MTESKSKALLAYQRKLQKVIIQHQRPFLELDQKLSAEDAIQEVYSLFKVEVANEIGGAENSFPIELASFRSRRGVAASFLRTLHSDPKAIAKIFNNPRDADSFKFETGSFEADSRSPIKYADTALEYDCLIKDYRLEDCETSESEVDRSRFPHRIVKFITKKALVDAVSDQIPATKLKEIRKHGTCIVFGRLKKSRSDGEKLDDLVALYSSSDMPRLTRSNGVLLCRMISITLTAFSQIERFDKEEFRRSAMARITELIPDFSDKMRAPASNVSRLLYALKQSFVDHPYFGTSTNDEDISVRFVKLDFTRSMDGENQDGSTAECEVLLPKLSIYPPAYANIVSVNATYFSHRHSKSVVKYLLGKWAALNEWKVGKERYKFHTDFRACFDDRYDCECIGQADCGPTWWPMDEKSPRKQLSGLYANRLRDIDFWERHSFTATDDENPVVTTAAFLLHQARPSEKSKRDGLNLPFGVLAFESKIPDAFAQEDLRILEELSQAVAHLIDLNGWSDVHVDYSGKIRDAILKSRFGNTVGRRSHIAFHLERLDISVLKKWLKDGGGLSTLERRLENSPESINDIWYRGFKGMSEALSTSQEFSTNDFLNVLKKIARFFNANTKTESRKLVWKRRPLEILAEQEDHFPTDDENLAEILAFLESIPSSEEWHARFSAIPRALLTRDLKDPEFTNFPTGFSADAIYVLDDVNEIRQILKFSDRLSIKTERENYQTFVRYHTPLAARMPTDGFAVDSNGSTNPAELFNQKSMAAEERSGFGVLVSDLVAGTKENRATHSQQDSGVPQSFLEFLYSLYTNDRFERVNDGTTDHELKKEKTEQFLQAITHHFQSKSVKWEQPSIRSFGQKYEAWCTDDVKEDFETIILDSSRLEQISDKNCAEEKFFDATKPFGTRVSDQEAGHVAVKGFLDQCNKAFDASITKFEPFHKLTTGVFAFDNTFTLSDYKIPFKNQDTLVEILQTARDAATNGLKDIDKRNVEKLVSVIHGDSHGRNLTWSDAFLQFQMIDFENVRFGYVDSDQVKLAISVLTQLFSCHLESPGSTVEIESELSFDFEEAIIALSSFIRVFNRAETEFGLSVDSCFFRRPFQLSARKDIFDYSNSRKRFTGRTSNKRQADNLAFLSEHNLSGTLTRVLRRILGSIFGLPDMKGVATHNLNTIRVSSVRDDMFKGADEGAFQIVCANAFKAFALKEFSYHLRSLTDRDVERLSFWSDFLSNLRNELDLTERLEELNESWKLSDQELQHVRNYAVTRIQRHKDHQKRNPPEDEGSNLTKEKKTENFLNMRIKVMMNIILSTFPKPTEAPYRHDDERVLGLASAYFVLLAANSFS